MPCRVLILTFAALLMPCMSCRSKNKKTPTTAANELPPGHPPVAPGGTPDMNSMANVPPPPSGTIEGTLEVGASVRAAVQPGDAIFVIARHPVSGTAIAATRLTASGTFPLRFQLSGANVMRTGTSLVGKIRLEGRIDKDGEARSKNPGDIVGTVTALVEVPAHNVRLILDTVVPESPTHP